MKVLIVGGAGFVGSWTAKEFTKRGHKVAIVDPQNRYTNLDPEHIKKIEKFRKDNLLTGVKIYKESFQNIGEKVLKKEKPAVVVHLAATPLEKELESDLSRKQLTDDILTSYEIVSSVKKYPKIKLVYLSSISAYGDHSYAVIEKSHLNPKSPYGISKAVSEFLIKANLDNRNIIRTTSVYGFGDLNNRATQIIVNKILSKEEFWVNDNIWLDFIYVKDLARGIAEVALKSRPGQTFHISGGKVYKLSYFAKLLSPYFGKFKFKIKNLNDRANRGALANSKARILLNWNPKYSLKKGIADYIKYVKKYSVA